MKQLIILLAIIAIPFSGIAQNNYKKLAYNNARNIPWEDSKKLVWSDFKARPDGRVDADAVTAYSISIEPEMQNDRIVLMINNNFLKHESWVKEESDHLLTHEQGHFNIAEIYVRKLRMEINALEYSQSLQDEIDVIYERIFNELDQMQQKYDRETNLSRNKNAQKSWDVWMERQLRSLEAYKFPAVIIDLPE